MSARLAERLTLARQRRFVGRSEELDLVRSALTAPELPFFVLHIHGPGGIGKTTLLGELAALCEQLGVAACTVDGRRIEPLPDSFLAALGRAMGLTAGETPIAALVQRESRAAILIDTYESLAGIDGWLRDTFLPQLPEQVLVVLAGRDPPSLAWRADPGWQSLVRIVPLPNLSREESRAYLAARAVPADQQPVVLDFTHGHPLALSLVADVFAQRGDVQFRPEAAPDIIKTILEQFVQKVPGPAHRAALEVCALVRLTTEDLLGAMLSMPDVHELFDWLRGLSFVESGRHGLFPHDLVRDALDADLRWRNPDWYAELRRRARAYYTGHLPQVAGRQQQRLLADYIYLHRTNALVRPLFEWSESSSFSVETAREADWPDLLAMVAGHEGEEAAQLARFWLARQPAGALAVRAPDREIAGMLLMVELSQAAADLGGDPATAAAWDCLQRRAPLRPGEHAIVFRFWMARDSYQAVSAVQSQIFIRVVRQYLTTPGLAFTFFPCADPEFWAAGFAYADLARLPEADFSTGGRRFGVYGHDWRAVPPLAWLALLADREVAAEIQEPPPPAPGAGLVVLSQEDFAAAVRDGLRDVARLDALAANPLLRSRLLAERCDPQSSAAERAAALQALLRETAEALLASPRESKAYRALYHTYIQPAPTQEQAAELIDLPFSTFRRHLKAGIDRVAELLWQAELRGPRG